MKNLKDKFKKKINFVKPLYKKVNSNLSAHTTSEFVSIDIDNKEKLCGNGLSVKRRIADKKRNVVTVFHKNCTENYNIVVPKVEQRDLKDEFCSRNIPIERNADVRQLQTKVTEMSQTQIRHSATKFSDTWLRVYPAPILPNESVYSIIFRCLMCQMGLGTFLVLWTLVWVMVIHYYEGPFEKKVSQDFKHAQNQLVIDLATELRQITPLSPKWRNAIEERIETERQLTIAAVGRGARLHPGHFWDIPGTFLFTVYVMTALGFGAPVPQTIWGRTTTLIYAVFAVPTHIYLMVNLSTCVVVNVEYCIQRLRLCRRDRPSFNVGLNSDKTESPNCSRNSELKPSKCKFRRRIICIVGMLCMGRGVPLAMLLYYLLGVMVFGVARSKQPLEVAMFPLEFTTTGGLEHVECYVRIIYGIYVEGAMILLSCALSTLRLYSSGSARNMADQFRLFAQENQSDDE